MEHTKTMLNSETAYIESGRRAGLAMRDKDIDKADRENAHFRKLQSVESGFDKARSQALYNNAYREACVNDAEAESIQEQIDNTQREIHRLKL